MNYIFDTRATMKEYNRDRWWIDPKLVPQYYIAAANIEDALRQFQKLLTEQCSIQVSNNALRKKVAMFVDTEEGKPKQVGYVVTGKTSFSRDDYSGWTSQYIDLWVRILTTVETEFK